MSNCHASVQCCESGGWTCGRGRVCPPRMGASELSVTGKQFGIMGRMEVTLFCRLLPMATVCRQGLSMKHFLDLEQLRQSLCSGGVPSKHGLRSRKVWRRWGRPWKLRVELRKAKDG